MRTLHKVINYESRSELFKLYYLTDLHYGASACAEKAIDEQIAKIANDPNAIWIGGGDFIDAIARKGDKRYMESTLAPWLRGQDDTLGTQRDYCIAKLRPIMDKCAGMVCGNHEYAALKYYDRNIYWELVSWLAQSAKVSPTDLALGVQGFVVLKFRRQSSGKKVPSGQAITVYCHHGYGGGRLPGGHALTLGRTLGDYDCDLALLGHRHVQQALPKQVISPASHRGGARAQTRYGVFCGHFLNTYIKPSNDSCPVDSYAEEKGLPPNPIGTPTIVIKPDVKQIDVVLHMQAGKQSIEPEALPKQAEPLFVIPQEIAA